ncbi:hypothetical protein HEK616_35470 [Streptomyces nigrescens]|uniref:Secreted protein n=2 Tax=Streptomyces TaxID=1883 RepID=A0ABM7ZUK3_STRNI|nr:hypothetical protein [Streptomyces nigrescens]MEE4423319.1 hypothetical protein [Streptomyces sp. DSM 41528]BDM70060.1 hypothetical protein HEK616_35470 [Streptomyces nigrescens]
MTSILARTAAAAGAATITATLFASPAAADATVPPAPKAAAGAAVVRAAMPSQAAGVPKFRVETNSQTTIVTVTVNGHVVGRGEWDDPSNQVIARDYARDGAYIQAEVEGPRASTKGHQAPYTAKERGAFREDIPITLSACYMGNGYKICSLPYRVYS